MPPAVIPALSVGGGFGFGVVTGAGKTVRLPFMVCHVGCSVDAERLAPLSETLLGFLDDEG